MNHRIVPTLFALWGATGCQLALGLDEFSFVENPEGVVWFTLGQLQGQMCSWPTNSYQLPEQARDTITSTTGEGARITDDGETLVACRVAEATNGIYDVSIEVASGEVNSFRAAGRLSRSSGASLDVAIQTPQFSLGANNCTATVRAAFPGAFWIQDLTCLDLRDGRFPGVSCAGIGGLIFERCSQ